MAMPNKAKRKFGPKIDPRAKPKKYPTSQRGQANLEGAVSLSSHRLIRLLARREAAAKLSCSVRARPERCPSMVDGETPVARVHGTTKKKDGNDVESRRGCGVYGDNRRLENEDARRKEEEENEEVEKSKNEDPRRFRPRRKVQVRY